MDYYGPGTIIQEVDSGRRPIEGVNTAVAGFIGFTEDIRGDAELFKPMLVTNWTQYLNYFASPNSSGFTDFNAYLPFAVYGYFLNGGGRCYITSIGTGEYYLYPPLPAYSSDQFAQVVEGDRDERTGVRGIFEIDDITMLAFPDLMRAYETKLLDLDRVHGIMKTMVSLTEETFDGGMPEPNNRMVLLDPPPDRVQPQEIVEWLEEFGRRSSNAALYYPWIEVPNPRNAGHPILVPPCGHMMGVWAHTDQTAGVHKAPANVVPKGVTGLAYYVNFQEQELLNPLGINCIRKFPNRGIRVWGARTLVEPDITEWRYISVRRLVNYVEKSVQQGTQWVVFEPNDEDLWSRVRRKVSTFLKRIWREGGLFGSSPQEAFFVKCDAENNPPETMNLGRLYIEVGIAPVRPAEFIILRFSQLTAIPFEL